MVVELDMDKGYITWDYRMFPLIHRYIYCVIIDQSKNIKILKKKKWMEIVFIYNMY